MFWCSGEKGILSFEVFPYSETFSMRLCKTAVFLKLQIMERVPYFHYLETFHKLKKTGLNSEYTKFKV